MVKGEQVENIGIGEKKCNKGINFGSKFFKDKIDETIIHIGSTNSVEQVYGKRDYPGIHFDDTSAIEGTQGIVGCTGDDGLIAVRAAEGDIVISNNDPAFDWDGYLKYNQQFLGFGQPKVFVARGELLDMTAKRMRDKKNFEGILEKIKEESNNSTVKDQILFDPYSSNMDVDLFMNNIGKAGFSIVKTNPDIEVHSLVDKKELFRPYIRSILGENAVPKGLEADNYQLLLSILEDNFLKYSGNKSVLKISNSASAQGNLIFESLDFSNLDKIREIITNFIQKRSFEGGVTLEKWDDWDYSPGVQCYIGNDGGQILGILDQVLNKKGKFLGGTSITPYITEEVKTIAFERVDKVLSDLFDKGYRGPLGFDLIVKNLDVKFIECNARYTGNYHPLLIVKRLFGVDSNIGYYTSSLSCKNKENYNFDSLIQKLDDKNILYNDKTKEGFLIVFSPIIDNEDIFFKYIILSDDMEGVQSKKEMINDIFIN